MIAVILDPNVAVNLRRSVTDDVDFSYNHKSNKYDGKSKKSKLYPAWDRICALMDRIQDTADHINNIQLYDGDEGRSAFSFMDLMNYSAVLIECIYEIARVYGIDMDQYKKTNVVFNNSGRDGKGSDKEYFEYLRSLCSVHPNNTDRHGRYQDGDYECCPYVYWGDEIRGTGIYNVNAMVYTDRLNAHKVLIIAIQKIKEYIEYVYSLIDTVIIPGIEAFKERCRDNFRKQIMKRPEDFLNYISYLEYLKEESQNRYSEDNDYLIDNTLRFFSVQFNEEKNKTGLLKMQNALKTAIHFYHMSLQNMSWEGYVNTGIKYPKETDSTFLLYELLFMRNISDEAMRYGYEIEKCQELVDDDYSSYAYDRINDIRPFFERYVLLDEAKTRIETFVLTQVALYANALENDNLINKNIPNDLQHRYKLLCEEEIEELRKPPKEMLLSEIENTLEEYRRIAQQYLGKTED